MPPPVPKTSFSPFHSRCKNSFTIIVSASDEADSSCIQKNATEFPAAFLLYIFHTIFQRKFMKSIFSVASLVLVLSLTACNAATPGSVASQSKVDSLATVVKTMSDEFEILKYGLEKRGLSIEQLRAEKEADEKVWDIPDGQSPTFGNLKNPKLTIVEFSDFQCPYCARIAPIMQDMMKKHGDQIKFVFKFFPLSFHKDAPAAAAASMAAQKQGKFWEFRYAVASHNNELSPETFEQIAKTVGIKNIEQFKKDMVLDSAKQARIDADFQLGVKIGVQGTPNFFVNGKRQDRFSPDMIEEMLKK